MIAAAAVMVFTGCGEAAKSSEAARDSVETGWDEEYYSGEKSAAVEMPAASEESWTAENAAAPAESMPGSGTVSPVYGDNVKLIFTANLTAETTDIEAAAAQIEQLTASMGGYIESSSVDTDSDRSGTYRYANYTVRVPSENYEGFLAALTSSDRCTVTNVSKTTQDVGLEYADTEARLETLRIRQKRYQELLAQATEMDDIISLEEALSNLEYEIEWYASDLNRYDSLIGFSTIRISMTQVRQETVIPESDDFGDRVGNAFQSGLTGFGEGFQSFLVFLAYAWLPILIVVAIIVIPLVIVLKVVKKKTRRNAQAAAAAPNPAATAQPAPNPAVNAQPVQNPAAKAPAPQNATPQNAAAKAPAPQNAAAQNAAAKAPAPQNAAPGNPAQRTSAPQNPAPKNPEGSRK